MLPEPIHAGRSDGPAAAAKGFPTGEECPGFHFDSEGTPTTNTGRTTTIGKRTRTISHVDSKPVGHPWAVSAVARVYFSKSYHLTVSAIPQLQFGVTGAIRSVQVEAVSSLNMGRRRRPDPPRTATPARHCTRPPVRC